MVCSGMWVALLCVIGFDGKLSGFLIKQLERLIDRQGRWVVSVDGAGERACPCMLTEVAGKLWGMKVQQGRRKTERCGKGRKR